MIKLQRPPPLPSFTAAHGKAVKAREALAAQFASDANYQNGSITPQWDSGIWTAAKESYIKAQFGKCVFCESRFTAVAHGDVEHFRPKSGYNTKSGQALKQPGYWWLAYDWNNYWASCQICNQSFKKNLFPLNVGGKRAVKPEDDLSKERPLLIDPAIDDPATHIEFRNEVVLPRKGSKRGKATIEITGLDRVALTDERRAVWQQIMAVIGYRRALPPQLADLKERMSQNLRQTIWPEAPYSAMARDLLAREAPELISP